MKTGAIELGSGITIGSDTRWTLIAGPCQIESLEHCLMIGAEVQRICRAHGVDYIFKSSFDKANRTSIKGRRGPGMAEGLEVLAAVRKRLGVPVITDVHLPEQTEPAAAAVDILQIPAFLCRQTDLLQAAAKTGRPVLVKKGQFVHPSDMRHAADKIIAAGNRQIMLCERGSCFGYRDLVVDMRSLIIMRGLGFPVIFDATHSVQSMGGSEGASGGSREYVAPLARAAMAAGVDGIFLECHEDPPRAPSDAASMLPLAELERLVRDVALLFAARSKMQEQ